MSTKVLSCSCKHDFQDKKYGRSKRLHNKMAGSEKALKRYRCTVCAKVRDT